MDCAFDDDTFDSVSFDTCASQPTPQVFPSRGGGGRKRIVIYNPPQLDDDDVLFAWLALEELI